MTIERNPVPASTMKKALQCIDFDAAGKKTGDTCERLYRACPKGTKFMCPNKKANNGRCTRGDFLYPRRWAKDGSFFHFHQGIDLGAPAGSPIHSVTDGTVILNQKWNGASSGYGNVVAVYSSEHDITFWYAHCQEVLVSEGQDVTEKEVIARVGSSGLAGSPHLHFETLSGKHKSIGGAADERELGNPKGPRLDPLHVLESLGPWGARQLVSPRNNEINEASVKLLHASVETVAMGGYFPLGANNVWHGGVHLTMDRGEPLHAPFGGRIVAVRLDTDPAKAMRHYGSTNFVLLRHELPQSVFDAMKRGDDPSSPSAPPSKPETPSDKPASVGEGCTNLADDVLAIKRELRQRPDPKTPYYAPTDPTKVDDPAPDDELYAAIRAFQATLKSPFSNPDKKWPDGKITVDGYTWNELFPSGPPTPDDPAEPVLPPPPPPVDAARAVYSLFMHVDAVRIDGPLAKKVPWLAKVRLSDPDPAAEEAAKARHAADVAEASRHLEGSVGHDPSYEASPGTPDDILWVQRRLQRHSEYTFDEATQGGVFDDELEVAIRRFQEVEVPYFIKKKKKGDGVVEKDGSTYVRLATPERDFRPGGEEAAIDPTFLGALAERDDEDVAKVVSGLDVPVRGGEVLWVAGEAQSVAPDGSASLRPLVHWEIFAADQIVTAWAGAELVDDNEDLTLDVPERIYAAAEAHVAPDFVKDEFLRPWEVAEFYGSGRADFLRRTPCRFRNQWDLDLDAAIGRFAEMGFDVEGLADKLRPYMWWPQATDVLPASSKVWHYNPIELLALYQAHLDGRKPPPPPDPELTSPVVVTVLFDNRVPIKDAQVELSRDGTPQDSARTGPDGKAIFAGKEFGTYAVHVTGHDHEVALVWVRKDETATVEVVTKTVGPPPPKGDLRIIVRNHKYSRMPGLVVELRVEGIGIVATAVTDTRKATKGEVLFPKLSHGDYLVTMVGAEPTPIPVAKKSTTRTIQLSPPKGVLKVTVKVGEDVGAGIDVMVQKDSETIASERTNADGVVSFVLPEGSYRARVGRSKVTGKVKGNEEKAVDLVVSPKDAPVPEPTEDEEEGRLEVWVQRDGVDIVHEVVVVEDEAGYLVTDGVTDVSGTIAFELPPGEYLVTAADVSEWASVAPWSATALTLELLE